MTPEQEDDLLENMQDFDFKYDKKYRAGQKEHSGNMWEMGAYQALENMEDEILDSWSYCRQVRLTLDQIVDCLKKSADEGLNYPTTMALADIEKIVKREKKDD